MVTNEQSIPKQHGALQGLLSFLFAIATAGSVTMIGFTSFTTFDPPGWLRIATMAPLPFLIVLAVGFGVMGMKMNSGRVWAIAGLVLTTLALIAFMIMINVGG
jgi:hypothetical protein